MRMGDLVDDRGAVELDRLSQRASTQSWVDMFLAAQEHGFLRTTMGALDEEQVFGDNNAFVKGSGPVWSLTLARMQVFSQARFQWTRYERGEPADLFGSPELALLERPWRGGTTADLLARMELDATSAGQAYIRRVRRARIREDRLVRLRPGWVITIMGSQEDAEHPAEAADVELLGYAYVPRGDRGDRMLILEPDEVAHYAPYPDPDNVFVGMSWITPVVRDVLGDQLQAEHKRAFFRNAAPQPLDAQVLTPTGWTTMGEVSLGDWVIGSDGGSHRVIGVYPQGEQEIYRVEFADGGSTECTPDHLWTVSNGYDRKRGVTRSLTLAELMDAGIQYDSGAYKWAVPLVDPVEFDQAAEPLPVDPYLLGLLLGDGSFRGNRAGGGQHGSVTMAAAAEDAEELAGRIASRIPDGTTLQCRDRRTWSEFYFAGPGGPYPASLKVAIRGLGLWGKGSRDKFIPPSYLTATVKDRVAVLQGLIDSDGSIDVRQPNLVRLTTNSDRLAAGAVELVRGLGGLASMTQHGGRDRWTVVVRRLPDWIVPARLLRKTSRYEPATMPRCRTIVAATKVDTKPTQCIRVDVEDSLYVTDDYVVTHNTPNLAIKFDPSITLEAVKQFKEFIEAGHKGAWNAYKTLYLGGGADPVTVGKDMQQLEFAVTQGKGESRMASASGVPPSWVGFSEGLQGSSLNAGNFTAARRRFGDGTMQHLWSNVSASLETIVDRPDDGAHLWFATRGIPFLRMDAKDAADVQHQEAQTIVSLIRDGFTPESARAAVQNSDWGRLVHTGLVSVQLQEPGQAASSPNGNGNQEGARAALLGGTS